VKVINSIADLREVAERRVPRAIFQYADHGAFDEITLRRNRSDFDALKLRQRVMIDVRAQSMRRTILGREAAMPLVLAPCGLTGLMHRDGEILAARAAERFGVPLCLSTVSVCSIEDVRGATTAPFWFQLYVMKDRGYTNALVDRAEAAGCEVLVMTVDIPVSGVRRRDAKNGLAVPPRVTLANVLDMARKPAWVAGVLMGKRKTFGNLASAMPNTGVATLSQWIQSQFDASVTWDDLAQIRARWKGKLVVKGILDPEDARRAVALGADAIIISNHGGRQLDGAPSTISMLPRIAEAVGGQCEVLLDSGVRCGQDILKAVALGANAVLAGRAYLYGLGARGEAGVTLALEILANELRISQALTGCNDIRDASPALLQG
jgi:L-lactate dehydrogenase (cytochrome)